MEPIIKEYEIYEDSVMLYLTDTRDNYVDKNSLGEIGFIGISPYGALIAENFSIEETLERKRENKLQEEFIKIFKEECNPLSEKYYPKILSMIENGELSSLGYNLRKTPNIEEEKDKLPRKSRRNHN
ncbi:MAG: hypothetical protein IJE89_04880 [Bacilli bacterium]|nr:hypothetical protein [Bacilli bacterium]